VDDFILIHEDKQLLLNLVKVLREFLATRMGLELHPDKIYLQHYTKGVQFLNAYIKPHRTYIRNRTKTKTYHMLNKWNCYFDSWNEEIPPPPDVLAEFRAQINSYLGFMIHQNTYNLRRKMLLEVLSPKAYRYLYAVNLRKMVIKKWVKS
jgi:hypothetical protein